MSERSNQTAEVALRYYLATLEDPSQWPVVLARMPSALNNSTKYSTTNRTPTQIMYGFRTREALDLLRIDDPSAEGFDNIKDLVTHAQPAHPVSMDEYRPSQIDAKDAIAFAALKMKEYYDATHAPLYFSR